MEELDASIAKDKKIIDDFVERYVGKEVDILFEKELKDRRLN